MAVSTPYRVPPYAALLEAAERTAWDEAAVPLAADVWDAVPDAERAELRALLAGFVAGEIGVARDIAPFARAAAADRGAVACFERQRADELRHARAFGRIAHEVLGEAPEALAAAAPAGLVALFDERLPGLAASLAGGEASLAQAVALYHGAIEGAVFLAGQDELLDRLSEDGPLGGVREIVWRVQRDERWHVGLGMRCLVDAQPPPEAVRALYDEACAGVAAWGPLVEPAVAERTLAALRRRLRVTGLLAVA